MNEAKRPTPRSTVDTVLARERIDVDEEIRDRLTRQLPVMESFRERLRTPLPVPEAEPDAGAGSSTPPAAVSDDSDRG